MKKYIMIAALVFSTNAMAESENFKPKKMNVDYSMCENKTSWFEKSWCETVEYQKAGWAQGKKDLKALPSNLKAAPGKIGNDIKNTFTQIGTGVSNVMTSISNKVKNVTQN